MTRRQKSAWHKQLDSDGIVWLTLDVPNSQTNTLTAAVIEELAAEVELLLAEVPKGLVLRSAKANGFLAGADINSFAEQESVDETYAAIKTVQDIFSRIESLT